MLLSRFHAARCFVNERFHVEGVVTCAEWTPVARVSEDRFCAPAGFFRYLRRFNERGEVGRWEGAAVHERECGVRAVNACAILCFVARTKP